jgi:hypothetical protein
MIDPIEGIHYLVDLYAVLGVVRDATSADINAAWRKLAGQYSADRLHGMAPQLRTQAEAKSLVLNRAKVTLFNETARAAYDAKLATWKRPISDDGTPIINMSDVTLFEDEDPDTEQRIEARARDMAGYNPKTVATLERLHASDPDDTGIAEALAEAYGARETYLAIMQSFVYPRLGLDGDAATAAIGDGYVADVERELANARDEAVQYSLAVTGYLLEAGKPMPLLGPGPIDSAPGDTAIVLAAAQEALEKKFDEAAAKARAYAEERAVTLAKRLELMAVTCHTPTTSDQLSVVLVAGFKGTEEFAAIGIAFSLDPVSVVPDRMLTAMAREAGDPRSPEASAAMAAQGVTVLSLVIPDGIDPQAAINEAVNRHLQRLVEKK